MLSPYRVVDLSDERGMLCGQILADMGADVIQVEPPGGLPLRRQPPFDGDRADPERSLPFFALARNKRGIELDLDCPAGRELLRRLVQGADFLIDSAAPAVRARQGLDPETLASWNPELVHVAITPFGTTGPKAHYAATDLVVMAAGGALFLSGDADRPPVRVSVPQAFLHASADAAVGALIAHHERQRSGLGQHVDVSAQQAVTLASMFGILDSGWGAAPRGRAATGRRIGRHVIRTHFRARDGWVVIVPGFATPVSAFMDRLMHWAADLGLCGAARLGQNWARYGARLLAGEVPDEDYDDLMRTLERLFASKTKAEILRAAVARRLLAAPVLDVGEVLASEQFAARGALWSVAIPGRDAPLRVPGPFARFSRTPLVQRFAPPRLGAGDPARLAAERAGPAPRRVGAAAPASPLEGVKVLDLFWVLAGPGATRSLADWGATVVHVESSRRRDTLRSVGPAFQGRSGAETSGAFQCANAGKLLLSLDLKRPEAHAVLADLVRWADVMTESFAPGVLQDLGFGYTALCELKPDIILISSCLMGQSGPLRDFAGYGSLAASVTGFQGLAAWPDRAPAGPYGAYTDYIAARYNAIAILGALEHRARTGMGQHIDMSQAEAALHFLGPAALDFAANGRVATATGNRDPSLCPHGVYPAAGADSWVAIAVRDDTDWRALCAVLGRPEWVADTRFSDAEKRLAHAPWLDAEIGAWTAARPAGASETLLQARGVPAHAVLDMAALAADPQLSHRGHLFEIEHPEFGRVPIEGTRFELSRSRERRPRRGLRYGCDNTYVLRELLGYDAPRIAALESAGVLV